MMYDTCATHQDSGLGSMQGLPVHSKVLYSNSYLLPDGQTEREEVVNKC